MINLKTSKKNIIGMVHTLASPGAPMYGNCVRSIIEKATHEAQLYEEAGFDAILIENMHDIPYLNREVGEEVVAILTAVATAIKRATNLPVGIQVLAGANKAALAIALAADLDFIRAEGFVFGHMADEGLMNSDAGTLLRYRKQIGAEHIAILTDVMKKHSSHHITSDIDLTDWIEAAIFFKTDGIIITGSSTGKSTSLNDVKVARGCTELPLVVGSGIDQNNLELYWDDADCFIVGSSVKEEGIWSNELCIDRMNSLMAEVEKLRTTLK